MWQCANCGEEIEETFNACWKCGAVREGYEPYVEDEYSGDAGTVPTACIACGSERIVEGKIPAHFTAHDIQGFALTFSTPGITIDYSTWICLHCGLLWGAINREEAFAKLETWGNGRLKRKLHHWKSTSVELLRPSSAPTDDAAEQLLRPASSVTDGAPEELLLPAEQPASGPTKPSANI